MKFWRPEKGLPGIPHWLRQRQRASGRCLSPGYLELEGNLVEGALENVRYIRSLDLAARPLRMLLDLVRKVSLMQIQGAVQRCYGVAVATVGVCGLKLDYSVLSGSDPGPGRAWRKIIGGGREQPSRTAYCVSRSGSGTGTARIAGHQSAFRQKRRSGRPGARTIRRCAAARPLVLAAPGPVKDETVGEALKPGRLADGYRPVLLGVRVLARLRIPEPRDHRARHPVPGHPAVPAGVVFPQRPLHA